MKLRYRRILYLSFIFVFLAVTPLVMLYTAGYGYNFKKGLIEKTGILYVDSKPKSADIMINGAYSGKTMKRFPKLLPDTYQLEVSKEGYYPWKKEIEIKSNMTEFAEDIVLFKNVIPINIVEAEVNLFNSSPDQLTIIYSAIKENNEELRIFNVKDKTEQLIKKTFNQKNTKLEFVNWSESQNQAIYREVTKDFNRYFVVDVKTLEIKELIDFTRLNFSQVAWGMENDVYLYGLGPEGIYQIDLANSKTEKIIAGKATDIYFNGNILFYLSSEGKDTFLNRKIFGIQASPKPKEIQKIKLSPASKFTLLPSRAGYITLLNKKNNDLFIISENAFEDENIENNIILQEKANSLVWSRDYNKLLYYNDFEIWTYDIMTQQKDLVTRVSEPVEMGLWYPGDKYIIYLSGNKIHAIEATPIKTKNDTLLADLTKICCLSLESRGREMYFKAKAGNKEGIYQLTLQ